MNPTPQPQPHTQPAIQAGADALIAIIETERTNAAAAARDQFQRLEQLFFTYQQHAENMRATDQAKLALAYQQLLQVQARFSHLQLESAQLAQLRGTEASATVALRDDRENLRAEIIRATMEALEARRVEALATKQFEELQSALQRVGIIFNSTDNSLQFSAGWAFVLAELETEGRGTMNPEELHELLGRLTQRLQGDREKISTLQGKIHSSEKERQKMAEDYEMKIASLKLEVSMLHDAARSQSPSVIPGSQPTEKSLDATLDGSAPPVAAPTRVTHPTPQTLAAWNSSGGSLPFTSPTPYLQVSKGVLCHRRKCLIT